MPVREYEHVPPSGVLGAAVVHCARCGKRLAPHDAFPVREEGGRWSCIVCPASITPRTFTAPMLDASRPGLVRDVTIEVHSRSLIVRVSAARVGGEDAPHHRAADFSEQRAAIVAAFPEVVTEIANAYGLLLAGFETNERVAALVAADDEVKNKVAILVRHHLVFKDEFRLSDGSSIFAHDTREARDVLRAKAEHDGAKVGVDTGFDAGVQAERVRLERLIAKWAPMSNGVDDRLLADIRSGATS